MSLVMNGKEVYPLELRKIQLGNHIIYDRDTRGKSWCIIDLEASQCKFIPAGSTGLITADGAVFTTFSRYHL